MSIRECTKVDSETLSSFLRADLKIDGGVVKGSAILYEHGFPVQVVQHYQSTNNVAEVHLDTDDLWLCLEGVATFICCGRLAEPIRQSTPGELTFVAPSIIGGEVVVLKKGDWLLIPAGQPHQPVTKGLAYLALIKRPAKEGRVQLDYLPKT